MDGIAFILNSCSLDEVEELAFDSLDWFWLYCVSSLLSRSLISHANIAGFSCLSRSIRLTILGVVTCLGFEPPIDPNIEYTIIHLMKNIFSSNYQKQLYFIKDNLQISDFSLKFLVLKI
jgi:hypothetical protein